MKEVGMRDWFAGMAMQGMLAGQSAKTAEGDAKLIARAYEIADQMIEQGQDETSNSYQAIGLAMDRKARPQA